MESINYELPTWAVNSESDSSLTVPALGTFLGVLADVALVTHAVGGTLMKRGPDFDDLHYPVLLALQRYVSQHMALMENYDPPRLDSLGVAPNGVIVHAEWLREVEHVALTLAYNLEVNPDGIPVPVVYNNAAEFANTLKSYARHARDFYTRLVDDVDDVAANNA
jgi:hypothetical protein